MRDFGPSKRAQWHLGDDPRTALRYPADEFLDLGDARRCLEVRGCLRHRLVDQEDVALGCERAAQGALGDLELTRERREHGVQGDDVLVRLVRQLVVDSVELEDKVRCYC